MHVLNDIKNWNISAPPADQPLPEISPLSLRATALLARSGSPLLNTCLVQIVGAISMLSGMEYHYERFMEEQSKLPFEPPRDIRNLRHEAVAWLNRVGQFHAFCRSELVRKHVGVRAIPAIEAVMPFRNKHAAHRSIDCPRKEDTDELQLMHAMSLSDLGGLLLHPRPVMPTDTGIFPSHLTHYVAFQMNHGEGRYTNLIVEADHPVVAAEAYEVLRALLQSGG